MCSESSFLAIWTYRDILKITRAFYKDIYWHKATWHGRELWMTPIGDWDRPDWDELLTEVVPPGTVFGFIPEYLKRVWEKTLGDKMVIEEMRDEWDYLYGLDKHVAMEGPEYADIRANVRKFMNKYNYEYSEITPEDIPILIEFYDNWMKLNEDKGKMCQDLLDEYDTNICILNNWNQLPEVLGGKLTVDGNLAAFVVVEALDDNTISGHILKADYSYKGVYQAMQHMLYDSLKSRFTFLNAWSDSGVAGLRTAKLSWNTLVFIKKYFATWLPQENGA